MNTFNEWWQAEEEKMRQQGADDEMVLGAMRSIAEMAWDAATNKALIAAAPDLLEALDELANGYAGNRWDVGIAQRLAKARAAIAKARGE